jgi:hypothetical protein
LMVPAARAGGLLRPPAGGLAPPLGGLGLRAIFASSACLHRRPAACQPAGAVRTPCSGPGGPCRRRARAHALYQRSNPLTADICRTGAAIARPHPTAVSGPMDHAVIHQTGGWSSVPIPKSNGLRPRNTRLRLQWPADPPRSRVNPRTSRAGHEGFLRPASRAALIAVAERSRSAKGAMRRAGFSGALRPDAPRRCCAEPRRARSEDTRG